MHRHQVAAVPRGEVVGETDRQPAGRRPVDTHHDRSRIRLLAAASNHHDRRADAPREQLCRGRAQDPQFRFDPRATEH